VAKEADQTLDLGNMHVLELGLGEGRGGVAPLIQAQVRSCVCACACACSCSCACACACACGILRVFVTYSHHSFVHVPFIALIMYVT